MDNRKIGIKIADGSFYPVLDGETKQKKRMVLTTVKDNQESVQIDLYRGAGDTLENAQYIGSLMVEDITPGNKGSAEIELDLGVDENGQLEGLAMDKASGSKQSLSVSLKNLEEGGLYEVPDFSFEDEEFEDVLEEELPEFPTEEILGEAAVMPEPEDVLSAENPEEEELVDFNDFEEEEAEEVSVEPIEELFEEESLEEPLEELPEEPFGELPEELEEEPLEEPTSEPFETETFDIDFDEEFGEDFTEESIEEADDFSETEIPGEPESEPQWKQEYTRLNEGFEEDSAERLEKGREKGRPVLVALLVILAVALIGALLYLFVFISADTESVPPLEAQNGQEAVAEGPDQPDSAEAAAESGAGTTVAEEQSSLPEKGGGDGTDAQTTSPGQQNGSTTGIARESSGPTKDKLEYTGGVWYKIRWGDTLWEISSSFYDNPWLYGQIANENEIPNPDKIFADESIFIPKQ